MLTFSTLAQTKFIKEYHYNFIVDKEISTQTIDSLVNIANSALKNVDRYGYGLRIVNDGIQNTISLGTDYNTVMDSLSKLRKSDYLGYITKESIITKEGRTPLGASGITGKEIYAILENIEKSGYILAHEALHNWGAGHSPTSLNPMTNFLSDDLMSTFSEIHAHVYPETKKMIWKRLINTQFYDFKIIE
jgi:hypothetical protein